MEAPSGLRSRNREDSLKIFRLDDEKQIPGDRVSVVSLRVWAFLLKVLSMNQRKSSQLLMLLCLGLTSSVSWLYLRQAGERSSYSEQDWEDYHHEMGRRVREKVEMSSSLDPEEHTWLRSAGYEIHHEPVVKTHLPPEDSLHIAIMMPFIDHNPLAAAHYITMLEWITIYSSVRIHFHIITNEESSEFVDQIMLKVNFTSNCNYDYEMFYLDEIINYSQTNLCPDLVKSEEYCDLLIGRLTPLLFPWLFPNLYYIVYVDKHITFHDDVGKLYNEFLKFGSKESIAMVQEQSPKYLRSFGSHHVKSPGSKLGRPPRQGNPGYNPDLMVMDLVKLRVEPSYKALIHELKISLLLRKYTFHLEENTPDLGEVLNLISAEKPEMFHKLSCEWNKSAQKGHDPLSIEFLDCLPDQTGTSASGSGNEKQKIKATNNKPNSVRKN